MELAGNFSATLDIGKWGETNLPNHPIPVKLTHSFTIVQSIRKNDKGRGHVGVYTTSPNVVPREFTRFLHTFSRSKLTLNHF